MVSYYVLVSSRSHAFLLEHRLKSENVECELSFIPRELSTDLCNMGVRFAEDVFPIAAFVIRRSGLPGYRIFKQVVTPGDSLYSEVGI